MASAWEVATVEVDRPARLVVRPRAVELHVVFPPAEGQLDAKKRRDLAVQALKGLHDEAVWVILWQLEELMGISKKVKGFKMRADNFIWARDAYVEA